MLIVSLNANGLQASIKKGMQEKILLYSPDIICLQEVKCQSPILQVEGYYSYWNYSERRSYSGTAVFTKTKPLSCKCDFGCVNFDVEGRIITLEYDNYYLVNVYVPNSRAGLGRVDYRMEWDDLFFEYVLNLEKIKPVIICGDFNVALYKEEISNIKNKKFINSELDGFYNLLNNGYVDAFKYKYPTLENSPTWWNMTKGDKKGDFGYRLDYFLVSNYFLNKIVDSKILSEIKCSDHCPITLEINI